MAQRRMDSGALGPLGSRRTNLDRRMGHGSPGCRESHMPRKLRMTPENGLSSYVLDFHFGRNGGKAIHETQKQKHY